MATRVQQIMGYTKTIADLEAQLAGSKHLQAEVKRQHALREKAEAALTTKTTVTICDTVCWLLL